MTYKRPEDMTSEERWKEFSRLLGAALAEAWLEGRYDPSPRSEELVPEAGTKLPQRE